MATNADPSGLIFRGLDTVGDGTGTKEAIGDYSVTPTDFKITAPSAYRYSISRMIVCVEDSGGMQAQEYGNLGSALTNGIQVLVLDGAGATTNDMLDGDPVKTNADWGAVCYDVDLKTWGAGDEMILARWTFERAGAPVFLAPGHSLAVRLNDNFTGLVKHKFEVHGVVV